MAKIDYRKLHSLANELFATLRPANNDTCLVSDNDFFSQQAFESLKARIQAELRSVRLQLIYPESSGSAIVNKTSIKEQPDIIQVAPQALIKQEQQYDKPTQAPVIRKNRVDLFKASLIYFVPCLVFAAPLVLIGRFKPAQKPAANNAVITEKNGATVTSYLENKRRKNNAAEAFALGKQALQQEKISAALEYFRVAVSLEPANKSFLQSLNDTEKIPTVQKKTIKKRASSDKPARL